jgi:Fic family protein
MTWLSSTNAHPLIASCAFHYELEFIHPFSDGIGRLWQTLMLSRWQPILAYLPIETVIKQQQSEYYHMLSLADQSADCNGFIEFMLSTIRVSLQQAVAAEYQTETRVEMQVKNQVETRVEHKPDTASQILALLSVHPEYTLAQVAQHLNRATSTVERAVTKLKQQERLRYIGSRKAGHWEVMASPK